MSSQSASSSRKNANAAEEQPLPAEQVDEEVLKLLSMIPDKYKQGTSGGGSSSSSKKKRSSSSMWSCEPITVVGAMALIMMICILVSMSMSTRPFWAFKAVRGQWYVEPQGALSRRRIAHVTDDLMNFSCTPLSRDAEVVALLASYDAEGGTRSTDGDKLIGELPRAHCTVTFGPVVMDTDMHFVSLRAPHLVWTWTGPCNSKDSSNVCSLTLTRRQLLVTIFESAPENSGSGNGGGDSVLSFLLQRIEDRQGEERVNSWGTFWDDKGRFLFAVIVMVIILKAFVSLLGPKKENARRKLLEARLQAAKERREKQMQAAAAPS